MEVDPSWGDGKRLPVRHKEAKDAYDKYCKERKDKAISAKAELRKKGLEIRDLQQLFALEGNDFICPQERPGSVTLKNLKIFAEAMSRPVEDFIDWHRLNSTAPSSEAARARKRGEEDVDAPASRGSFQWAPESREVFQDELSTFAIKPQHGLRDADACPLLVTVSLPRFTCTLRDGDRTPVRVAISVGRAQIKPTFPVNIELIIPSRLGEDVDSDAVDYDGTWTFGNPRGNSNPLSDARLCDIRALGKGPHSAELLLRCDSHDIDVVPLDRPPDLNSKDEALLRMALSRLDEDPEADKVRLVRISIIRQEQS